MGDETDDVNALSSESVGYVDAHASRYSRSIVSKGENGVALQGLPCVPDRAVR